MLHLLNGDAVLPAMRSAGLPGDCAVWGDVLWEGPLLPDVTPEEQCLARATWFAWPQGDPRETLRMAEAWDRAIEGAARHDEVVIWLEHDLHDQFQLLHHLAWFARQPHPRLTLICISEFPGVVRFTGWASSGRTSGHSFPTRQPVTPAQLDLGGDGRRCMSRHRWRWSGSGGRHPPPHLGARSGASQNTPTPAPDWSRTERMILEA
jgi:hypothetical protein